MSKPKSQVILIGILGAVFGGVVYTQRETYLGPAEPAAADILAIDAAGGLAAGPTAVATDQPTGPTGAVAIDLENLVDISPFKQSRQLRQLYEPERRPPRPFSAPKEVSGPRFVSQSAPVPALIETEPAATPPPEPNVEAVFVDRSGQWRAIVGAQRVSVGDQLIDYVAGTPYAEVISIDAGGVDIRLLDEDELAVDPFN